MLKATPICINPPQHFSPDLYREVVSYLIRSDHSAAAPRSIFLFTREGGGGSLTVMPSVSMTNWSHLIVHLHPHLHPPPYHPCSYRHYDPRALKLNRSYFSLIYHCVPSIDAAQQHYWSGWLLLFKISWEEEVSRHPPPPPHHHHHPTLRSPPPRISVLNI